ncbi:putative RNA-directed DNA polymerase from transposon X-element, partial [Nephila pilipes]
LFLSKVDTTPPGNSQQNRSFQNDFPHIQTMDTAQASNTETVQAVSIPTIKAIVNNITHSDQCLQADVKIDQYISCIPTIQFGSQEEKNNYASDLYTIQEEVRTKFNVLKHEELRIENEKYKELISSWGLPDATKPFQFQIQSRRKKSTPVKNTINKKQKITDAQETECTNQFNNLIIEEPPEQIEVDNDEDVTPAPEKKEARTTRPVIHTAPTTYAEAARSSPVETTQDSDQLPSPASSSNITNIFQQLKDPECLEMFSILKQYIQISKSAINIETDSQPVTICSVYRPPRTNDATIPDLQKILRNRPVCILVGDYNAKHNSWNHSRRQNRTGTLIKNYTQLYGLDLIAPPVPTRTQVRRNESPATIDFGITKGLNNTSVTVIDDLSSDHLPLMFNCNINDYSPPRNNYYKFTNWKKFQELLQNSIAGNPSINTTEEIDAAAAAFSQKIQATINQSSTCKTFPHAPLPLPAPIRTLISTKNSLQTTNAVPTLTTLSLPGERDTTALADDFPLEEQP